MMRMIVTTYLRRLEQAALLHGNPVR